MKNDNSIHQRISKNTKRKESIASDGGSSESDYDSFIQIKKEVSNTIIIDKKIYDKLIQYIQNNNSFQEKIKKKVDKNKKKSEFIQSTINQFTIISTKHIKTEKEESQKNEETKKESKNNIEYIKEDKNINNINNVDNNEMKINQNTSMMSLFMNSQKGREKDKEEIAKLKSVIDEINKKNESEINNYKDTIKDLSNKIESLQKEIKNLNEINKQNDLNKNLNKNKIELIYSHPKLLSKIISYLDNHEKIFLSKCNSYLYKNIYFKAISEKIYKKLKTKEKILAKLEGEDLTSKFDVKEKEISELLKRYIIEQKVSGKEMRNEIVKSLIFLEKYVKIPLANYKNPMGETELFKMEEPKKGKFFSKFLSAFKSEIKEGINNKNENILSSNYISFTPKEYVNIFDTDRHVLETFKTDQSLNVKFDYNNSDKIKEVINEFFNCQLPQTSYKQFISKISETFSDLLYAAFIALNDIKNLQIVMFALYCRYMNFKLKIEDLQSIIEDLNHFADSFRQIKEMLTKSKIELEFKYTNAKMTISQLNNVIAKKDEEIKNMNLTIKENNEKYNKFKNEIINEYNKIKDDFNFTKKERDSFKEILIELKDFFVKVVTGEILN